MSTVVGNWVTGMSSGREGCRRRCLGSVGKERPQQVSAYKNVYESGVWDLRSNRRGDVGLHTAFLLS